MNETKTEEKLWKSDSQKMIEFFQMLKENPQKAHDFFIEAGIWDKEGNLTAQYSRTE